MSLNHNILPEFINNYKLFVFFRELLLDIFSTKDILQIHPLSLASQPLVNNLRYKHKFFLKLLHFFSNLGNISGTHHRLNFKLMIIQSLHNIFNRAHNKFILAFSVRIHNKIKFTPFLLNFLQLIFNLLFPTCTSRNLLNSINFVHNFELEKLS